MDVMVGQTDRASYQIWQGRQGNHTRFVNHSCQPNSQYERFVWLGTQRIVLVSKGIEAGEEITVDYSDTYWKVRIRFCEYCLFLHFDYDETHEHAATTLANDNACQNLDKECLCGQPKCRYRNRSRILTPPQSR